MNKAELTILGVLLLLFGTFVVGMKVALLVFVVAIILIYMFKDMLTIVRITLADMQRDKDKESD